jgi:hypothetical protein
MSPIALGSSIHVVAEAKGAVMKRILLVLCVLLVVPASSSAIPPERCGVSGGGTLVEGDRFSGNVTTLAGSSGFATGTWRHTTPDGRTLVGDAQVLVCRRDGCDGAPPPDRRLFCVADARGSGTFGGEAVNFLFRAIDDGEPGSGEPFTEDRYAIVISDQNDEIIYHASGHIHTGNIQVIVRPPIFP